MSEQRDFWGKLEIASSIIGGIFLPLMIWWVGSELENQERESDQAQLELDREQSESQLKADRALAMLDLLTDANPQKRLLAAKTAEYLNESNQLPEELWPVFVEVGRNDTNEAVAQSVAMLVQLKADSDSAFKAEINEALAETDPTVYVHYSLPLQSKLAQRVGKDLRAAGFTVPRPDRKRMSGNKIHVRIFREDEMTEGSKVAEALNAAGIPAETQYVKGYEDKPDLLDRTYEVWIGEDVSRQ